MGDSGSEQHLPISKRVSEVSTDQVPHFDNSGQLYRQRGWLDPGTANNSIF